MSSMVVIISVGFAALLISVPMGYWRATVKKFSVQWFLAIHLAVPLIYLLRTSTGLGYTFIPGLVLMAMLGQVIGAKCWGSPIDYEIF